MDGNRAHYVDRLTSSTLLTFASYLIVPVNKCTLGVVTPRPDVQFEEIRQVETVRRRNELEVLAFKGRRRVVVILQPGGCIHNELDAQERAFVPYRFIDQRFGVLDIDLAITHQFGLT